jgi:hypothetical protein
MTLAYITHIENSLNFDIDFPFSDGQIVENRFDQVASSEYYYTEDGSGMVRGTTYRSRLEGIDMYKFDKKSGRNGDKNREKIIKAASFEFNQVINRCGRFVKYEISGIDVYRRFVVKLYDPISGKCLNDIFLQPKYNSVFFKYLKNTEF